MNYQGNTSVASPLLARNDAAPVQRALSELGFRSDSKLTAILFRQIEFIKTQLYNQLYPELKYQKLIPLSSSAPMGAGSVTYRSFDSFGQAKIISNYADDLPMIDVAAEEFTVQVKPLGASFQYSIQDLNQAFLSGVQLDVMRAARAREAIERKLDSIGALGDADSNLLGLLNHPQVPIVQALAPGAGQTWLNASNQKTPVQIIADLAYAAQTVVTNSLEIHVPDTILLSPAHFAYIAQTPMANNFPATILQTFLANSPYIRNVESWNFLTGAGAAGATRLMAYKRDPNMLSFELPLAFEQLPPQQKSLAFVVPCHARCAGILYYYPKSAVYMDNI